MAASICKFCNTEHHAQSGFFTRHLKEEHNITLKDYIIQFEYNGIPPKCQCGYCNDMPNFRRGKFSSYAIGHNKYDYLKEQYIKYNGIPKCPTCKSDILSWNRGLPIKYCNRKCQPNQWNQDKVKETVKSKYGVDNVYQIPEIINIIKNVDKNPNKAVETKKRRYKNGAFDSDIMKASMQEKYGVNHASQIPKNKKEQSERMKRSNPMFDIETVKRASNTLIKNIACGKTKLYNTKKYKYTDIYYQSSYELEFLELCESLGVLDNIRNGNSYECNHKYLNNWILTDFSIGDIEIEIKSTYIMNKQGGLKVLNAKRKTVEDCGKKYVVILDKDYSEFLEIIK